MSSRYKKLQKHINSRIVIYSNNPRKTIPTIDYGKNKKKNKKESFIIKLKRLLSKGLSQFF